VYSVNIAANEDVTIGAEVHVRSLLFLDRPGRMDVGDGCDIDALDIVATEEVTIGARVQVRARLRLDGRGRIVIGEDCVFGDGSGNNAIHAVGPATTVRIGRGCYVNGLDVFATEDVTVGERCKVGSCSMVTTDFHSTHRDRWSPDVHAKSGPITLGENVWVASNTIITKGVSIGDNSVVSIGTVVRDDVPANVIVSSHHQRVVKELPS
jgi:acetyltransferase-like isoleucine patch superfamily enzyme